MMMSIGEVARAAGLRASAVRYYERLGLLPTPERRSGRRRYTEEVLDRLAVIGFARETGFRLREIRTLFAGQPYSARLRTMARAKLSELDQTIARAKLMQKLLQTALRCTCLSLEECGERIREHRARS